MWSNESIEFIVSLSDNEYMTWPEMVWEAICRDNEAASELEAQFDG